MPLHAKRLNVLLPERLVRRARRAVASGRARIGGGVVCLLAAKGGAGHALVRVGRLLDNDFLGTRLARAAACREEPEQARGNGKGDAEPHG